MFLNELMCLIIPQTSVAQYTYLPMWFVHNREILVLLSCIKNGLLNIPLKGIKKMFTVFRKLELWKHIHTYLIKQVLLFVAEQFLGES